jgi:catalase
MTNFKGDIQVIKTVTNPLADDVYVSAEGVRGGDHQASLHEGEADAMLLENHALRDNIIRFGHIPESETNTSAAAAQGTFTVYESQCELTKALFLQDPGITTPVFVRFSTVDRARGSADCARDPRDFAVRFHTREGNFDLVGSNIPVSYVQDASILSDLLRVVRSEAGNQIPHVSSTHNTFWDFISLAPESTHALLWVMSDRAIPRSFAMMEGFGVHTFRFVNAQGKSSLVKFHWKPLLGVHSLVWDESMKLAAKDADFHRRHLWELIDQGHFPEWELGVQVVAEEDRYKFDFDLQDATKLIPESLVPLRIIGKLTLDRNPENYFAEIEQVVFHPQHLVAGIELIDNSLLKKFSYSDAKMSRLCSLHFNELPINRSRAMIDRLKRESQLRALTHSDRIASEARSSIAESSPATHWPASSNSFPEAMPGKKAPENHLLLNDHYSQAALFWRSQSAWEQNHLIAAFWFELAKVSVPEIRERIVFNLTQVDRTLAMRVAEGLGITLPASMVSAASLPSAKNQFVESSLSMAFTRKDLIIGRCIAVLVANGFERERFTAVRAALLAGGASLKIIASRLGEVKCNKGQPLQVDNSLATVGSVMFDAVYVPGGQRSVEALCKDANAVLFVKESYKHGKGIAASNEGGMLITRAARSSVMSDVFKGPGVITAGPNTPTDEFVKSFVAAVANHRFSERPDMGAIVA